MTSEIQTICLFRTWLTRKLVTQIAFAIQYTLKKPTNASTHSIRLFSLGFLRLSLIQSKTLIQFNIYWIWHVSMGFPLAAAIKLKWRWLICLEIQQWVKLKQYYGNALTLAHGCQHAQHMWFAKTIACLTLTDGLFQWIAATLSRHLSLSGLTARWMECNHITTGSLMMYTGRIISNALEGEFVP